MNQKVKLLRTIAFLAIILVGAFFFYKQQSLDHSNTLPNEEENTVLAVDFNVQDEDGKNVYLSSFYDGKPIIINFWASTCPPCRAEMPDYQTLYNQYHDKVHFVMIDCVGSLGETKADGQRFVEENGYTFPILYDVNQNAISAYGIRSFPTTYVINGQQELVAGGTGMIDLTSVTNFLNELLEGKKDD